MITGAIIAGRTIAMVTTADRSSMTDLETLAKGLTAAQREAIIGACTTHPDIGGQPFVTVDFTDPWTVPGVAQFVSMRTDHLTPLGLQVRAYLMENSNAE
tara:strand:+ start:8200 stop:8499 length:300 start_codon:yes stop_codon:yes gene_type:complete